MTLIALHGFLGSSDDWNSWTAQDFGVQAFIPFPIESSKNLQEWAQNFNRSIALNTPPPRILMGYSMGGRLALQALNQSPNLWAKGILISTHPGLKTEQERQQRLQHDQTWADRFLNDSWKQLMADWEAQPVFHNATYRFNRPEVNRALLSSQLLHFSLGNQLFSLPNLPLLWITGENDPTFSSHAREICLTHSRSKLAILPNAGHRAPWEAKQLFVKKVKDFLT